MDTSIFKPKAIAPIHAEKAGMRGGSSLFEAVFCICSLSSWDDAWSKRLINGNR
jgi:hypothetical protein